MQLVDPLGGAAQQRDRRREVQLARGDDPVVQRTPRDQLLDEVAEPTLLTRSEHRDHVRVRDLLRGGDLALEAAHEDLVLGELGRHDLDRDGLLPVGDALEDDAHAATPDGPGDPVGPYGIARPGLECDLRHTSARSITACPVVQSRPRTSGQRRLAPHWWSRDTRRDLAMDKPTLGDYRIEGIVGVGRMGVVYLAIDRITGRAVALKVLREDVGVDPVYRARSRREGELLSQLQHPHVIPIHGMGEIEGELYIASRLVSSTLRNAILAGPLTIEFAMIVLASVASALDAAHALGIVHRDVKPANVLIDPAPRRPDVFLADFGLARDMDGAALTAPGQVLGTIDYMAPELLDGERVGPATDIYGLACLACETLTGTVPFLRDTDAATMYAHIVEPPPSICQRRPELPRALDEVLAAGMAKDPEERPPSAGALVVDMLAALGRPAPAWLVQAA